MKVSPLTSCGFAVLAVLCACCLTSVSAQYRTSDDGEFGPVVRAYLGYLRNEQEVVDDRVSRHEVTATYYRRNSSRIRALRQMALRIARESRNDYLPELEAVTRDELRLLFEQPPQPQTFRAGEVVKGTFRFLGPVRSGEVFYVFARLDPYEQSDLMEHAKTEGVKTASGAGVNPSTPASNTRERRVIP